MSHRLFRALVILAAAVGVSSCDVFTPNDRGRLEVQSDPPGADVEIDSVATGKITPATFNPAIGEQHHVLLRLVSDAVEYRYETSVEIKNDSVHRVNGPLLFECASSFCSAASARLRTFGNFQFHTLPSGALAFDNGILWPAGTINRYASGGSPLIAMLSGDNDTLALAVYDAYLRGRPAPQLNISNTGSTLRQTGWIVPPTGTEPSWVRMRGIEIREEIIGHNNDDVVYMKLTFRNITNTAAYRLVDSAVPDSGMTFRSAYVGFGIDADIGYHRDDAVSYEPALDLAYAYDMDFSEDDFTAAHARSPALLGLRMLSKPDNTAAFVNGWSNTFSPGATWITPGDVYRGLSGEMPVLSGGDIGVSVSAGPVNLAPGAEATIVVAIGIAPPVATEFTPGTFVSPGDPTAADRPIRRIAATLIARARSAAAPQ